MSFSAWLGRLTGRRPDRSRRLELRPDPERFAPWPDGGWLVGGAVRDALLGRAVTDVDWLVADPADAAARAAELTGGAYFTLDETRGHWRVVTSGSERDYIRLDLPLHDDLRRRDFTINTLALARDGELTDVCGGLADLQAGLVRMTGVRQLQDDPLRLLRAVRIATELGFTIESATQDAIRELAGRLPLPTWERSRAELDRILLSDRAMSGVELLDSLGLLDVYLPELAEGRGVDQGGMHHADVLGHQIEALGQLLHAFPDAGLSLRWATLLHDIGKPGTRSTDDIDPADGSGRIRFHGHDRLGSELAQQLMRRLRQPAARTERVAALVRRHMQPLPRDDRAVRRFIHRYGELLPDLLKLMVADREAARGRLASEASRRNYRVAVGRVLGVLAEAPAEPVRPLLDGNELMELLELEPGPKVGQAARYLAELQAVGDAATREAAISHLREYARVQWGGED